MKIPPSNDWTHVSRRLRNQTSHLENALGFTSCVGKPANVNDWVPSIPSHFMMLRANKGYWINLRRDK